jgi:hypothetical protein
MIINEKIKTLSTEGWVVYPSVKLNYKVNLTPRLQNDVLLDLCFQFREHDPLHTTTVGTPHILPSADIVS